MHYFKQILLLRSILKYLLVILVTYPLIDETNYFFDNFQTFNTYRFVSAAQQIENGILRPVCGSYWNQLKLGICAAGCGVVSGGLAAGLCGWGCWCTFCTRNSALATVICAN
jgi:hypothetical protein